MFEVNNSSDESPARCDLQIRAKKPESVAPVGHDLYPMSQYAMLQDGMPWFKMINLWLDLTSYGLYPIVQRAYKFTSDQ